MHMLRGLEPMCPIDHNCCQWRSEETDLYVMKRTCSRLGCKALLCSEDGPAVLNAIACMGDRCIILTKGCLIWLDSLWPKQQQATSDKSFPEGYHNVKQDEH